MAKRYQQLQQLSGKVYREQPGRKTFATSLNQQACFIKLHHGVGWREIFKNLIQGRLPILGAKTEYRALTRLATLNIPSLTVLEFGQEGINPAHRRSYLVTKALQNTISLEDFCASWANQPPPVQLKRRLIRKVAEFASRLHQAGINHRDFYLCHFHLDLNALAKEEIKLTIIDLHRAQLRRKVPWRWHVKDIAGLYFSAMHLGLSWRDYLWFIRHYAVVRPWSLAKRYRFWQAVEQRAYALLIKSNYRQQSQWGAFSVQEAAITNWRVNPNTCDQWIAGGDILKDDATTTVAKILLNNHSPLLIKRYNVRGWVKFFKRLLRPSRAKKAFWAGLRLHELGLPTPKPLAYCEKKWGLFKTESYLVMEYVPGQDVLQTFDTLPLRERQAIGQALQGFLHMLALLRTSHGDMKASNFVWLQHQLYSLDLDACRMWANPSQHRQALQKDEQRLKKNNLKLI